MSTVKPPKDLRDAGKALWSSIASKYQLRPDEVTRLEAACRTADVIGMLEDAWRELGNPMVSKGSMGQEVEHPMIGSIDKLRKSRQQFLRQLKLPDDADEGVKVNAQREGGNTRWANAHGA